MLTKDDLREIRGVVREESKEAVKTELGTALSKILKPIKEDIKQIRQDQNRIIAFF